MGGDRYCGFCGKHETEVARLIAGPIANICNECVELQHGILNEDPSRKRSLHEVLSRARQRRIAELEAERPLLLQALWILLDGVEVVVHPQEGKRAISITALEDGGFLIRRDRAALSQEEKP